MKETSKPVPIQPANGINLKVISQQTHSRTQKNLIRALDITLPDERIYDDTRPHLDPESMERFCQVWAEVGRAILARRSR